MAPKLLFLLSSLFVLASLKVNPLINEIIIGIDLGTTYSCVGIYKDNRYTEIEILSNELNNRITPSIVAFTDDEKLVGESALYQSFENPQRTINIVKRLIGKKFNDPEV